MHVYKPNVSSVLRNNTQVDVLLLRQRQVTRFLPFWCDVITILPTQSNTVQGKM